MITPNKGKVGLRGGIRTYYAVRIISYRDNGQTYGEQTRTIDPLSKMRPCVGHDLSPLAPEATSQSKILGLATTRPVSKSSGNQQE